MTATHSAKQEEALSYARVLLVLEIAGNGGTEVYVEELADFLRDQGYTPGIVLLSGNQAMAEARFPGQMVHVVEGARGLGRLLQAMPKKTLVNLHLYSSLLPAAWAVRCACRPLLTTLHMPLAPWSFRHRCGWRMAVALSHACIGVSRACLQGYGQCMPTRSAVVSGPLPFDTMPVARTPVPRGQGRFTVAYAGRLAPEKSLDVLVNAVARLSGVDLLLIGDGPQRSLLEEQAKVTGVRVEFTGALPREQVFARLQKVDAFVLPSRFEGLGLAAIEAMALGVPTVTADYPASADYIDPDKTGLCFSSGDEMQLVMVLQRLMDEPDLCERLSLQGVDFVRKTFTRAVQFGHYKALIES